MHVPVDSEAVALKDGLASLHVPMGSEAVAAPQGGGLVGWFA